MEDNLLTGAHLAAYKRHLQDEERAPATVEKYLRDSASFQVWLAGRPVTKELTARWKEQLLEQGFSPATVNAKLSAVNGLLHFLGQDECRVKFLKVQHRVFRDSARELTQAEYGRLVETARALRLDRLALIMETICATGIRVSEIQFITVEAAEAGRTDISLKGKIRTILLPQKLCRKLLKFAQNKKIASGKIFCTEDGNGISRHQIWREMKALCKKAGVEASKVFPHNLRHLFAACFYRATRDIVKLADVLGHSSINTTRIYLLTTSTEHTQQLDRLGLVS